jgi:hypothetical protein
MPSTDRKPELTTKASMAQPISQLTVYASGLTIRLKIKPGPIHRLKTLKIAMNSY